MTEEYVFQEYPKMLYRKGVVGNETLVVNNPDEQAAAAGKGYYGSGQKPDTPKPKELIKPPKPKLVAKKKTTRKKKGK